MLIGMKKLFAGGSLVVGAPWGIPIRFHWSAALGALYFSRFTFMPVSWAAFFALILTHELGHAAMVRRHGKEVVRIDINALGGVCGWRGETTEDQRVSIAWGGVLAQAVVLVIALIVIAVAGHATTSAGAEIEHVAVRVNMIIAGINLLPIPPLDGAKAWRIIPLTMFGPRPEVPPAELDRSGPRPLVIREPRAIVIAEHDDDHRDDDDDDRPTYNVTDHNIQ